MTHEKSLDEFDELLNHAETYYRKGVYKSMLFEDWEAAGREEFVAQLVAKPLSITPAKVGQMSRDMYSVLTHKTQGEARITSNNSDNDGVS